MKANYSSFDADTKYHYTLIDALPSIISDKGLTFWASNCLYMNDSQEAIIGMNLLNESASEPIVNETAFFNNYFVVSFTQQDDDLSLWGMYAKNASGCALGIDFNMVKTRYNYVNCRYIDCDTRLLDSITYHGPRKYSDGEKITIEVYQGLYCLSIKHAAFRYENESRIVMCNRNQKRPTKFRVRDGVILPYIELDMPKEALREIVIGPNNNSELIKKSIEGYLNAKGYDLNNIQIRISAIPYRG